MLWRLPACRSAHRKPVPSWSAQKADETRRSLHKKQKAEWPHAFCSSMNGREMFGNTPIKKAIPAPHTRKSDRLFAQTCGYAQKLLRWYLAKRSGSAAPAVQHYDAPRNYRSKPEISSPSKQRTATNIASFFYKPRRSIIAFDPDCKSQFAPPHPVRFKVGENFVTIEVDRIFVSKGADKARKHVMFSSSLTLISKDTANLRCEIKWSASDDGEASPQPGMA
ncbi:MAG: hypothetical protein JWM04_844 [Verrucomicrobiales bacterium]|nr:hypothetical protein [Verrucomicrobiales bacterium]